MALDRKELATRTRRALGLMSAEGYKLISKGHLHHILNQAQQEVRIDLLDKVEQWSGTFAANARSHGLPTDFLKEYQVWVAPTGTFQGYQMHSKPYHELVPIAERFDTSSDAVRADGVTQYYYTITSDRVIFIQPVFSQATAFHLFYYPIPSDMTSDGDIPDMAEEYHETVLAKAKVMACEESGQFDKLQVFTQMYQDKLNKYRPHAMSTQSRMIQMGRSY